MKISKVTEQIIKKAIDNALDRKSNPDSPYKNQLNKKNLSANVLTEYILFKIKSAQEIDQEIDHEEILEKINILYDISPKATELFDAIFLFLEKNTLLNSTIPINIQEKYVTILIKICKNNLPLPITEDMYWSKEKFFPENVLLKISLEFNCYPDATISYYEKRLIEDPNDMDMSLYLILLYSRYDQYNKSAKLILTLSDFQHPCFVANNQQYIVSIFNEYPLLKEKIISALKYTIDNFSLPIQTIAFLGETLFHLADFDGSKEIFLKLINSFTERQKQYHFALDLSIYFPIFTSSYQIDQSSPADNLISEKDKMLISRYKDLSKKEKLLADKTLYKAIQQLKEDTLLLEKLKYLRDFRSRISPNTHNFIISLYITHILKRKICPEKDLITNNDLQKLGTGNYSALKNPYIDKLDIRLLKNKEEITKLNDLLIRDVYCIITWDFIIYRTQGVISHISGLEYLHKNDFSLALTSLTQSYKIYEDTDILLENVFNSNLQSIFFSSHRQLEGIIKKVNLLSELNSIFELKSIRAIRTHINNISENMEFNDKTGLFADTGINNMLLIKDSLVETVTLLKTALDFKPSNYFNINRCCLLALNSGQIKLKKFLDSIINFTYKLQQYPNLEEAIKDEKNLIEEFSEVENDYKKILESLNQLNKKADHQIQIGKEVQKSIQDPKPTDHFRYNYKMKLIRYKNKKGLLEIFRSHQKIAIKITEIQTDMLLIMAKNAKQRDKRKPDKDKGWTSAHNFIENVNAWNLESTQEDQVRTQINAIRDKFKKNTISRDLIETSNSSGYKISTHPDNITIEK